MRKWVGRGSVCLSLIFLMAMTSCTQVRRVPTMAPLPTAAPTATLAAPVVIKYYQQLQAGLTSQDVIDTEVNLKILIDAFSYVHPEIKVDWSQDLQPQNQADWFTTITQQKDCFAWNTVYWPEEDLNNLLTLDTFFQSEDAAFQQDFYPQLLAAERHAGHLYALPAASPRPLYIIAYNADLLVQRQLQPPDNHWTFADFIKLARAAASPSDGIYGLAGAGWDDLFLRGMGNDWVDLAATPPRISFDQPQITAALDELKGLVDSQAIIFRRYGPQDTGLGAVRAGKVAMWIAQVGNPGGDYFGASTPDFQIGVAPLPAITGYSQPLHSEDIPAYYISKTSQHPEQCWEWLKFLTSRSTAADGVPGRISVAYSADWEARIGPDAAQVYRMALEATQYTSDGPTLIMLQSYISIWGDDLLDAALKGADMAAAQVHAQHHADAFLICLDKAKFSQQSVDTQFSLGGSCFQLANPGASLP
jgi:ABC-type glycerol-3-phosphate transport system substrate-binding protein